jgi:phage gpG-like protein
MASKRKNKLDFNDLARAEKHLRNNVPKLVGERARRFFELSFRREGFQDSSLVKWTKRKRETKRSRGKKVLSNTGMLKNSIRRTKTTPRQIRISSIGLSYANWHNNGTGRLPKRQFMGNSKTLERGLQKKIEFEIKKAINL